MTSVSKYDFAVIGGGIFGCYSALYLHRQGFRVILVESEEALFQKASVVNQARLHNGYHYPRSIATARIANEHLERFTKEHKPFINIFFKKYYGIDRYNTLTNSSQFRRFCDSINIPCKLISKSDGLDVFNENRLEAIYETLEYSFDPYLIGEYYKSLLVTEGISILLGHRVITADTNGDFWRLEIQDRQSNDIKTIMVNGVINATYANINAVNRIFGISSLEVIHEISEICIVHSKALHDIGFTIMDGPFASIMPFGLSNMHSLSSVIYTHQKLDTHGSPAFSCQQDVNNCTQESLSVCNHCSSRPKSNYVKMERQIRHYLNDPVDLVYTGSLFTVKTKLKSSIIDDSRPTVISCLKNKPLYFCIFSGKINSIYEIEKVMQYV